MNPWVVIPTYNEKDNIEPLIKALLALPVANLTVLIVDDNSPDGTSGIVQSLQSRHPQLKLIIRQEKTGLGPAYLHGFQYALDHDATNLVQMDADFSHDPADVPKLLKALNNYDLVLGSRFARGISVVNWPLRRLLISIAGNFYARIITNLPFKDITGGFKAWRASALRAINLATIKTDGYGFQIETTYRAWHAKQTITELPIIFTERREGQSKMNKSIILEAVWLVWKLRFARFS
jgi:dolichol-phosphate mannosyltransferase